MIRRLALALAFPLALAACGEDAPQVDTSTYGAGADWTATGGDWAGSHFSRLGGLTKDNVDELGLAWEYDLGTARVQESTPLVIDGVMYASGNLGRVYALDAATGEELWTFTPEMDMQVARAACCDWANRGLAVAQGPEGKLVLVAALDGQLYALDAQTGAIAWQVDTIVDKTRGYTITGAPEVAGNLVVIGNAGAEYDTRGYVTAYAIDDGEQEWRFYTVPRDPAGGAQENPELESALETWSEDTRWDIGGGGTVWDAINYDPVFDQVIIGTGNGGPYPQAIRSPGGGDNLYLNSLVALDRETGRVNWHFQETPQDNWDLTATQPMVFWPNSTWRASVARWCSIRPRTASSSWSTARPAGRWPPIRSCAPTGPTAGTSKPSDRTCAWTWPTIPAAPRSCSPDRPARATGTRRPTIRAATPISPTCSTWAT
jgi:quinohemoprotein ethanol dehydrogenase